MKPEGNTSTGCEAGGTLAGHVAEVLRKSLAFADLEKREKIGKKNLRESVELRVCVMYKGSKGASQVESAAQKCCPSCVEACMRRVLVFSFHHISTMKARS